MIQKHKQLAKQLVSQLAEVEVQGQKYKKSYEKAKAYTTELEQRVSKLEAEVAELRALLKTDEVI